MKKDLMINFFITIVYGILLFAQNKYLVKYLGIEILGIMKLFTQLLQYLNIIELGLGSASSYALYKPLADKNQEEVSIILSTLHEIYSKIALLLFLIGIIVTPFLPFFITTNDFSINIYIYWIFYVVNTVCTYFYVKYIILFTANQEYFYVRIFQGLSTIFFQIIQIILIIKYKSFGIYILLLILDNLTQYLLFKKHFLKYYSYIKYTKQRYKGLIKDIKNLFWHKVGGLIVFNTDLILISKLISIEIVGIYASYQLVIQMIGASITIITNVLRPRIGKYISINTEEQIYVLLNKLNIINLFVAILISYSTIILINNFIKLLIGKDYILSFFIIKLIGVNIFVKIFRQTIEIFKDGSGFFDDIQSPILESIINLFFSIILGLKMGLAGIIIGTIISNISIILIYKPILVFKRCFDKDWKEYIKVYGNYLILVLLSLIVLNLIIKPFIVSEINGWIEWIIYAIKISSISGVVIFFIFLINKEFRNILREYILKKQ